MLAFGMCTIDTSFARNNHLRQLDQLGEPHHTQRYLWENYLPLMTHTQSVERGVKDAGTVGKTGRSEQHRSALAVVRSFCINDDELTKKNPAEYSHRLFDAANKLFEKHQQLAGDLEYKDLF